MTANLTNIVFYQIYLNEVSSFTCSEEQLLATELEIKVCLYIHYIFYKVTIDIQLTGFITGWYRSTDTRAWETSRAVHNLPQSNGNVHGVADHASLHPIRCADTGTMYCYSREQQNKRTLRPPCRASAEWHDLRVLNGIKVILFQNNFIFPRYFIHIYINSLFLSFHKLLSKIYFRTCFKNNNK